ncbi:MAG: hypothetical protein J3K34DRAFT_408822 [Monoraphidium minutum]|nr:MAG: hypothetical protein J3K34DRAFT_408822 [Monoraphidium minutum]
MLWGARARVLVLLHARAAPPAPMRDPTDHACSDCQAQERLGPAPAPAAAGPVRSQRAQAQAPPACHRLLSLLPVLFVCFLQGATAAWRHPRPPTCRLSV